jgi:alpha-mannosidase
LSGGPRRDRLRRVDREALVRHERPFALSFFPPGKGRLPKPLATLSDEVVQITAIKKAETGGDFVVRLFNPTASRVSTILSLPVIGKKVKLVLSAFEIKSLRITPRSKKIVEVDLLEKPLK